MSVKKTVYRNPVITGFFPDPSVCRANGAYYLVCSSFQFFPGVPIFESRDLVNWEQIGSVLTRESQLPLGGTNSCSGIFAPTIRFNDGRFYMVTTNTTTGGNFYVYTDDIRGEWSDPIFVEQGGIDPSLYFEDGKAYFMSNGTDENGRGGVFQCEIDIETGKKLGESRCIWHGAGGRFLESPHIYKIHGTYYLMAAEGGTEYGHMVVYARSKNLFGPFENYPQNPVLTNRNLGGYSIQGCGHADLVEDGNGNYWMLHLAFRQIDDWVMHHITGREVCLVPVTFGEDGWFTAGEDGTTRKTVETDRLETVQRRREDYTFANTKIGSEWIFLRNPVTENYRFSENAFELTPSDLTLCAPDGSPTFVAIRQKELNQLTECDVEISVGEAGITLYMTEEQHYELAVRKTAEGFELFRRLRIGDALCEDKRFPLPCGKAKLSVRASNFSYNFSAQSGGESYDLGSAQTKYLSTEIAGNFTGVVIGLYACKSPEEQAKPAVFTNFRCVNTEE
jgi:alpha-N-arabinofuranosidase